MARPTADANTAISLVPPGRGGRGADESPPVGAPILLCERCHDVIDERAEIVLVGDMPCHRGCAAGIDPSYEDAESPYCRNCLTDADADSLAIGECIHCGGDLR